MTYSDLKSFIDDKMRMSHIYQPAMIIKLLEEGGHCREREIAKHLLSYDKSQINYYKNITNNMVGRVLRKHDVVSRNTSENVYKLNGYSELDDEEISILIDLCEEKLSAFLEARGDSIYDHRKKSSGDISGTIKYKVLKRASFRCELCGAPADEKALEVDHILPRNHGGSDDITNLQALCYSCNAMKRDRDDTDFRPIKNIYDHRKENCIFCSITDAGIVASNKLFVAIKDEYPVTKEHTLLIPKRHTESFIDLTQPEMNAYSQLLKEITRDLENEDSTITGFNIGNNEGKAAGQTVEHCHIHVIPRRDGDTEDPTGGIRKVIPGKGDYITNE
ncbi:HIT domain-containing protein [Fodinibius saliphilus]|uniref:HIT domain-containing protein n=1 Tax=Fodinibius saliphilus TaxID=1920650 RepID=UPI001BB155B3|nr:HIT domain-containing protein [Fodinibius saliphilus]